MDKIETATVGADMNNWYRMQVQNTSDSQNPPIQIDIYDDIGRWGISARDFIRDLRGVDDGKSKIAITINSNGGDVFDGIAIHNTLKRLGERVTARVDGVAASAASIIAVGAASVVMPRNAMMMIHNPWSWVAGEADDMRKAADMLDKVTEGLVACYMDKSASIARDEVVQMMKDTTWLTAEEAAALGFVDVIEETDCKFKASAEDLNILKRMQAPEAFIETIKRELPSDLSASENAAFLINALMSAGVKEPAAYLNGCQLDLSDAEHVNAEVERINDIGQLCAIAQLKDRAHDYIVTRKTVEEVRQSLFASISSDEPEIDNKQTAKHGETDNAKDCGLSPDYIYAVRAAKPNSQNRKERIQ